MTVNEAAAALGLRARRVRDMLANGDLAGRQVAGVWDVDATAVSAERRRRVGQIGGSTPSTEVVGSDIRKEDGSREVRRVTHKRVRNERDACEVCEIDTEEWEVSAWDVKVYEANIKDEETGRAQDPPPQYFSVWVKLRKRPGASLFKEIRDGLIADAKRKVQPIRVGPRKTYETGVLYEQIRADHHFAALAWGKETGWGPWDLKIASKAWQITDEWTAGNLAELKPEKIWFVIGNDLFDADTAKGQTFAGTQLEVDSRHYKVYPHVRSMVIDSITRMLDFAPVEVIAIYGNHDPTSTFHLADAVECRFHDNPHVTVNNQPTKRKYYRWGRSLIGLGHGDNRKKGFDEMVAVVPVEAGRLGMWDTADIKEFQAGHLHTWRTYEAANGVLFRRFGTLYPPNAWAAGEGYVGSRRSVDSVCWHKDRGPWRTESFIPDELDLAA